MRASIAACLACLTSIQTAHAITLDLSSRDSIKAAAKTVANGMLNYYSGNKPGGTPGILPKPYYWWEAGAMFGALIDYYHYTGDDSYNSMITQAMLYQAAPGADYMPANQTKSEGNDDQAFWAIAAMQAAETNFPNPPSDQPQWLALVQAVFNLQAFRWDTSACGGGLKWQIVSINAGWTYRNSISNGCFFNIAARLGMYTGNTTYLEYATKMWNWVEDIGLISDIYEVYDGTDDTINCTRQDHTQWTYNNGVFLYGAAVMWNQTNGTERALWEKRVQGFLTAQSLFFAGSDNKTMQEYACETTSETGNCNTDQLSFKAYLARWMAATTKVAPWTRDHITPLLAASAQAAAQSCSGGSDGVTCGTKWIVNGWDKQYGLGQQMTALEVIQSNLIEYSSGPVSNSTGGTSVGNPSAGTNPNENPVYVAPITMADKAGAGILTGVLIIATLGGTWWIISS